MISPASAGAYLATLGISYSEGGEITTDPHLREVNFSELPAGVYEEFEASSRVPWCLPSGGVPRESNQTDSNSYISDEEPFDLDCVDSSSDEEVEDEPCRMDVEVVCDPHEEPTTEMDNTSLNYSANTRYICLVVITDTLPEPDNPHAPNREYVMSLEVMQDKPFTRHHIRLPHAALTVHLRWDDFATVPEYQIRRFYQVPRHRHEMSIVHHGLADLPCSTGPCSRRCFGPRSEAHQWVDENLRHVNRDSDEEVRLE
ncbi:uncharacterized protein Z519_06942 [Cladophialophora bantiana CBS 173.52]|uniref:Uncharacterized protein n=1 Tax=Cladophialophora bantiana (strain ATCC 10958 / CBS 173.52 / CDC B-1940 / NIH 8579) TaxID=1442370 RepID=A0A0D2HMF4_CLAB1|nr:uncharacterized protein Z519_06942 [Cladophialophora bantiana CBS 173.52]KIW91960.1 hypothetical protein Z519_06942 [Cladophialophora bantiana CBS 173.52]